MKAFKYMKIDMRRTKMQIGFMMIFGILAYSFSRSSGNVLSGMAYLLFAAILMEGAVFTYEQKPETGFTNLLPGTDFDRVLGRFLMGIFLILYGAVLSAAVVAILYFQNKLEWNDYIPEIFIMFLAIGLVIMTIQNILFYMIGKGNSQQLMSFIHMLPGFIIWIISSVIITVLFDDEGKIIQNITRVLSWIQENSLLVSLGVFVAGIAFTIAGIFISEKVIRKKDFA